MPRDGSRRRGTPTARQGDQVRKFRGREGSAGQGRLDSSWEDMLTCKACSSKARFERSFPGSWEMSGRCCSSHFGVAGQVWKIRSTIRKIKQYKFNLRIEQFAEVLFVSYSSICLPLVLACLPLAYCAVLVQFRFPVPGYSESMKIVKIAPNSSKIDWKTGILILRSVFVVKRQSLQHCFLSSQSAAVFQGWGEDLGNARSDEPSFWTHERQKKESCEPKQWLLNRDWLSCCVRWSGLPNWASL